MLIEDVNKSTCVNCNSIGQYILNDKICAYCSSGCKKCLNSSECDQCSSEYFLNVTEFGSFCISKDKISFSVSFVESNFYIISFSIYNKELFTVLKNTSFTIEVDEYILNNDFSYFIGINNISSFEIQFFFYKTFTNSKKSIILLTINDSDSETYILLNHQAVFELNTSLTNCSGKPKTKIK